MPIIILIVNKFRVIQVPFVKASFLAIFTCNIRIMTSYSSKLSVRQRSSLDLEVVSFVVDFI